MSAKREMEAQKYARLGKHAARWSGKLECKRENAEKIHAQNELVLTRGGEKKM